MLSTLGGASIANAAANDQQFAYVADRLSAYSDNRTSQRQNGTTYLSAIVPSSNRLLTVQGPAAKTYNYDPAGNLTSDGTATFTWNAAGRLYQTTRGGQNYTYTDNGLGERILKNSTALSNVPYRFVYDHAGHLIGEYDKNNSLRQEAVWLGDTPVALVKPAPAPQQNQVYYIQADHLNAPRVILNNANIPIWRWGHTDAFGTTLPNEDPDGDGNIFEYNLRFPGQYYDQETGLHYNYFRDYDPGTGRYIASDPIGLNGGLNTYGYVGGDPVNAVDPFGLKPGDKYKTQDSAGYDAACEINPTSISENIEYAGSIYQNDDGTFSYTSPAPGIDSESSNPMKSLPPDSRRATAWYHTHAGFDKTLGSGNFRFSPNNRAFSNATKKPNYMADPYNNAHRYDPPMGKNKSGSTFNFKEKCGCKN